MKVLITTLGSRGDVQPFIALGQALRKNGHEVVLGAPENYSSIAKPNVDHFIPFGLSASSYRETLKTLRQPTKSRTFVTELLRRRRNAKTIFNELLDQIASLEVDNVDVLVHHYVFHDDRLTDRLDVPAIPVVLDPVFIPTDAFVNPLLPFKVPRTLNRYSYLWTKLSFEFILGDWRRNSRLKRVWKRESPVILQAFSRHMLPCRYSHEIYPNNVSTTGYWFAPSAQNWTPPRCLEQFLHSAKPTVYVGLGSRENLDPVSTARLISEAIQFAGIQAVVYGGDGIDVGELYGDVQPIDEIPFGWLFPRVSAVVHHGGTGTVAAGVAAGCPQVVVASSERGRKDRSRKTSFLRSAGIVHATQPISNITPQDLGGAIVSTLKEDELRNRAHNLGIKVRTEGGVDLAVSHIESLAKV